VSLQPAATGGHPRLPTLTSSGAGSVGSWSRLAELLDEVANRREHVTITRHGRPSAVLVPVDEYGALEETAEILSDEGTLEAIRQGLDDIAVDDVVALDQLREDVARRSAS